MMYNKIKIPNLYKRIKTTTKLMFVDHKNNICYYKWDEFLSEEMKFNHLCNKIISFGNMTSMPP